MIDLDFIERLLAAFDASSADSLEVERGGTRVRLAKTPPISVAAAAPVAAAPAAAPGPAPTTAADSAAGAATPAESTGGGATDDLLEITSPMVGTFYRAPAPDAPAYVEVGKRVSEGETLCIIEAMKLMNELESEVSGTVREVCIENGQPVEYGQVLFRVEPG